MEIKYFNDTDTLLVVFNNNPVIETKDLNENTIIEFDKNGKLVSMTIEHAKHLTNILNISIQQIPKISTSTPGAYA